LSYPPGLIRNRLWYISQLPNPRQGTSLWIAAGDYGRGSRVYDGDTFLLLGDAMFGLRTVATNIDKSAFPVTRELEAAAWSTLKRKWDVKRGEDAAEQARLKQRAREYLGKKLSFDLLDVRDLDGYLGGREVRHISCLSLYVTLPIQRERDLIIARPEHIHSMLNHLAPGGTITYSRDMRYDLEGVCRNHGFMLGKEWELGKLTTGGNITGVTGNTAYMRLLRKKPAH
jgi:hypothetical protein